MSQDKKEKKTGGLKRILALIGVILLAALYITTLVCAIINSPFSVQMFKASIAMTILVPVLIYGYRLIYKVLKSYHGVQAESLEEPRSLEEAAPEDENATAKKE